MNPRFDFSILQELREHFLNPTSKGVLDYWKSEQVLAAYHQVLGERIRWKWQSVLTGMGSRPRVVQTLLSNFDTVVDWGCGPGVASQSMAHWFLEASDASIPQKWIVSDRSSMAMDFAARELQKIGGFNVTKSLPRDCLSGANVLGLVSHVLTELTEVSRASLVQWASACGAILWVEPGTPYCSDLLVQVRQQLMTFGFVPLAPCPHSEDCPFAKQQAVTLGSQESQDWCHFHASPPNEAFQTAFWAQVAKEMKLDLRDLSVSYILMVREPSQVSGPLKKVTTDKSQSEILLGRLHRTKVESQGLFCTSHGLKKRKFLNKKDRALLKQLEKSELGEIINSEIL